jgi:glycosyltransferase involved in cell wall biosynthesis
VQNGVDPGMFDPDSDGREFRRANGLEEKFVALYAGAHGFSNDLGVLLEAADRLRKDRQIVFLLVGDGKEKSSLVDRAARMQLSNVLFLPPVAKNGMGEVLAGADCGIAILKNIPLYGTTYPNKVFDYMAAARPVVLAIDGVIRKVVEEADAGVAVPPGDPGTLADAVRYLSENRELAHAMGNRGRRCVVRNFNRDIFARKMEQTLQEAVSRKRRKA